MKKKQNRLDYYEPFGDLGDPKAIGLIPHDKDFDFGTPSLDRNEDVIFIASNTKMQECLQVRLKWRPDRNKNVVTLISRLSLIINSKEANEEIGEKDDSSEELYEFEQVETYQPCESNLYHGRILEYGSASSKLKFNISSPYRRMRLIFNGYMQRVHGPAASESPMIFVRLTCVINPLTKQFDFLDQYNEDCLKQIYAIKRPVRTLDQTISDLVLHDRHEQKVRLNGEYTTVDHKSGTKRQNIFALWGFYARHFQPLASSSGSASLKMERDIKTCRLYAYMNNGQAFHIGSRQLDADSIDFGYTTFEIPPTSVPIDKPFKLDWKSISPEVQSFELEISGQTLTFASRLKQRYPGGWFNIETNGKPGWACVLFNDQVADTVEENESITLSRLARERASNSGELAREVLCSDLEDTLPYVVSIQEELCLRSQLVGAKAASLAQLHEFTQSPRQISNNYRVPQGFVLTKKVHELLLDENEIVRERLDELKRLIGEGSTEDLRNRCLALEELVRTGAKLPQSVCDELWARLKERYGGDKAVVSEPLFAVRSSSWGEDEADMSAAGQLSTILNVPFDLVELTRAAVACFASKFSYENIEYKRQHGMPIDLPMAVVVQEMVSCEKAGVMFTCEPATGDESVITITANFGLGESVVSAQADPDSIYVHNSELDVEVVSKCSDQENGEEVHESISRPSTHGLSIDRITIGSKKVITKAQVQTDFEQDFDRSKCCLSHDEIIRLADCAREIKRYFWAQRRDIEWGFMAGQLFLFQSRPVTGLETYTTTELERETDRPSQAELGYFTRANIGEVMPYAITPLTLTYPVFSWNSVGARLFTKYIGEEFWYVPQCATEVFHEKYHAFFNLRCSMLLPLSEEKRSIIGKSMEIGFFGREMGVQPEIIDASKGFINMPNPFTGTRFKLRTIPIKWAPNWIVMREKTVMDKLRHDVETLRLAEGYESDKLLGLYNQLRFLARYLYNCWENHIVIIMFATSSNTILSAILSKYISDPLQLSAATNKFLAISSDVISAEIPERVSQMARSIGTLGPEELERFSSMSNEEALEYMRSDRNKVLSGQFHEFMERFGHRCYNEFELAEFAWREKPEQVVEMVKNNCLALKAGPSEDKTQDQTQHRPKTIDEVIKSLDIEMTLKDKLLVKHVFAPKCQLMLSLREKTKNILVLYMDIIREASRMLARELQRQMRIPDENLLYYLMFDELEPLIRCYQPSIVCQAIRRRQLFQRSFSELWKFDEIISDITPNHMKPNRQLSEAISSAPRLMGTPASAGKVRGKICLVNGYKELKKVRPGSILLTHSTDIAFSPVFPFIAGIITEVGGLISHGAVVAREYGLPSIIGIPDVTRILQDNEEVILDADNGAIIRLSLGDKLE